MMKRLVTILMVLVMVTSVVMLSACATTSTTTSSTTAAGTTVSSQSSEATTTAAVKYPYIDSKTGAIITGFTKETLKGVKIGYCVLDSSDSSVALYANDAKKYFAELGAEVTIADAKYDQAKQIEQM